MPIYKLTPINENELLWSGSRFKHPVTVRATDEIEARHLVADTSFTNDESEFATPLPNPWTMSQLVSCEQITDSGYDEDDFPEILEHHQ